MFILKNWVIVIRRRESGEELLCLSGKVYGNPRFRVGQVITTSFLTSHRVESEFVVVCTRNGSEYKLGRPRATEVFAKQRLLRHLQRLNMQNGFDGAGRITDISGSAGQSSAAEDDASATILDFATVAG